MRLFTLITCVALLCEVSIAEEKLRTASCANNGNNVEQNTPDAVADSSTITVSELLEKADTAEKKQSFRKSLRFYLDATKATASHTPEDWENSYEAKTGVARLLTTLSIYESAEDWYNSALIDCYNAISSGENSLGLAHATVATLHKTNKTLAAISLINSIDFSKYPNATLGDRFWFSMMKIEGLCELGRWADVENATVEFLDKDGESMDQGTCGWVTLRRANALIRLGRIDEAQVLLQFVSSSFKPSPIQRNAFEQAKSLRNYFEIRPAIDSTFKSIKTAAFTSNKADGFSVKFSASVVRSRPLSKQMLLGIEVSSIIKECDIESSDELEVQGIKILRVVDGYAASRAGVLSGDVIVAMNDTPYCATLEDYRAFFLALRKEGAGKHVSLSVMRNGEMLDIPVLLGP